MSEQEVMEVGAQLSECEGRIATGWSEMASALLRIRDEKLYREKYGSFQVYCESRWGYKKSQAHRLMAAAETVALLEKSPIGEVSPENEAQVRPLTILPAEQRSAAWHKAVESAPTNADGQPVITAKHVEGVVQKLKPSEAKRPAPPPPSQDVLDVREIRKAMTILAAIPYSGDKAIEKFGFEAFGPKAELFCDWAMDFIGAHRGQVDISIRLQDGTHFHPSVADLQLWEKSYPMLDVEGEVRKCAAWNDANPTRRKTHKGIKKHIVSWLNSESKDAKTGGNSSTEFQDRAVEL